MVGLRPYSVARPPLRRASVGTLYLGLLGWLWLCEHEFSTLSFDFVFMAILGLVLVPSGPNEGGGGTHTLTRRPRRMPRSFGIAIGRRLSSGCLAQFMGYGHKGHPGWSDPHMDALSRVGSAVSCCLCRLYSWLTYPPLKRGAPLSESPEALLRTY